MRGDRCVAWAAGADLVERGKVGKGPFRDSACQSRRGKPDPTVHNEPRGGRCFIYRPALGGPPPAPGRHHRRQPRRRDLCHVMPRICRRSARPSSCRRTASNLYTARPAWNGKTAMLAKQGCRAPATPGGIRPRQQRGGRGQAPRREAHTGARCVPRLQGDGTRSPSAPDIDWRV
jgi:hypothetical protein